MQFTRFTLCVLLTLSALLSGCTFLLHPINSTFARHSNPIAGWTFRPFDEYAPPFDRHHYQLDKAIIDDYQQFIADKNFRYPSMYLPRPLTGYYDDERTGQRAVTFSVDRKGTGWTYVLIYDRQNKRIKAIRYVSGYYMC